mgnify:CR=1 FL=1
MVDFMSAPIDVLEHRLLEEAMALVKRIKSDPALAHTYSYEVHKWYTQDKQQNIQAELAVLLGHAQGA